MGPSGNELKHLSVPRPRVTQASPAPRFTAAPGPRRAGASRRGAGTPLNGGTRLPVLSARSAPVRRVLARRFLTLCRLTFCVLMSWGIKSGVVFAGAGPSLAFAPPGTAAVTGRSAGALPCLDVTGAAVPVWANAWGAGGNLAR